MYEEQPTRLRRERERATWLGANRKAMGAQVSGLKCHLPTMRTHRLKWVILVGCVLVVALGAPLFWALSPSDPVYEGRRLSSWLKDFAALNYTKRWDPHTKPAQAVRAIGTNAIPWLVSQLRADGGRWPWQINQLLAKQSVIRYRLPDPSARLNRATDGFQALGELGEPAIPALLRLLEKKPGYVPSALAAIGPAAVPALHQCLTNTRSYPTASGPITPIPGNTIGAIQNALNAGRLSKADVVGLLPAIRDWERATDRNPGQYNRAASFLRDFDR
jgi:hypothetical protein